MRKIVYVTGTRADYGLMKPTLQAIQKDKNLHLDLVVTGMHLMKDFGYSIKEIQKDNFKIHKINATFKSDKSQSTINFMSDFMSKLSGRLKKLNPDIILVLGDRPEMLVAAIIGAYLSIPVAHIHGGDVSSTIDEFARHAITKFSHVHFPATKKSAERIKKLGEENWRIQIVGAPGLDSILNQKLLSKKELFKNLGLRNEPTILVLQHPVTGENNSDIQIKSTLEVAIASGYQIVVIYPNSDPGGRKMMKMINSYNDPKIKKFKSIDHIQFLSLMNYVEVMIGNSSSGIIESSSFKLPVINIGTRQKGRERTYNVLDANYSKQSIQKALNKALSVSFKNKLKNCNNPYGDGTAYKKIVKQLQILDINDKLLRKQITY